MTEHDPNHPSDPNNPASNEGTPPARPKLIIPGQAAPPAQTPPPQPAVAPASEASPPPQPYPAPQPEATPQPYAAPQPGPAQNPQPAAASQPDPTPQPGPAAQPEPAPAPQAQGAPHPESTPQPEPTPSPQAAPRPEPSPTPQPEPSPQPPAAPTPEFTPTPQPAPQAAPNPAPHPQPTPAPQPAPQATPAPVPQATPAPQPQITTPQPAPQAAPAPAPVQQPSASPQVTIPLAGSPVPAPAQPQTPPAPVANSLQMGGQSAPSPAVAPPGGMPPGGLRPPGQPALGSSTANTLGPPKKKGVSNSVKVVIAVTLLAAIVITGFVLKGKADRNAEIERLNKIAANFEDSDNIPEEIPLSGEDVNLILRTLNSTASTDENKREYLLQALTRGKATGGNDISKRVATFAKDTNMNEPLRSKLFRVVGRRGDESALPALIDYASNTEETQSGQAALQAAKEMATTSNFQSLLAIITNSTNASIKSSARDILIKVISDSEDPSAYAQPILSAYNAVADSESQAALLRLLGSAGGDQAADLVADQLESGDEMMQTAAIFALRDWPNDSQFETLLEFGKQESDRRLRSEAFTNLVEFLQESEDVDPDDLFYYWSEVAVIAAGEGEQRQIVSAMGRQNQRWADDILDYFVLKGDTDRVKANAEDTKEVLATNISRANRSGRRDRKEKEEEEE